MIIKDFYWKQFDMVSVFEDTDVAYLASQNTFKMYGNGKEIEFRYVVTIWRDDDELSLDLYVVPIFRSWSDTELSDLFNYYQYSNEEIKGFYKVIDTPNNYDYPIAFDSEPVLHVYSLTFNGVDIKVNNCILDDRNAYGMVFGLINGDMGHIDEGIFGGMADGSYASGYGCHKSSEHWKKEFDRVSSAVCVNNENEISDVPNGKFIRLRKNGEIQPIGGAVVNNEIVTPDQFDFVI